MRKILITSCMVAILASCSTKSDENPFFSEFTGPYGTPDFSKIKVEHYLPAYEKGIQEQNQFIQQIISNPEKPTFANTIEALEFSAPILSRVNGVFGNLVETDTNDDLNKIQKEISPMLTAHDDEIMLNQQLFERIKQVYDTRESEDLTQEQQKVVEKYYKNFVRSGALLNDSLKEELKEINKELGLLSIQFADNVLAETNAFKLVISDSTQLAGLPQWSIDAAAVEAQAKGDTGKWVFTLDKPSLIPFLQYADNRDLRKKIYLAYINRGNNGNEQDNKEVINEILNYRYKQAKLLGYNTYADFILDDRMAKNTENVNSLLTKIWNGALSQAKVEIKDLQAMIDKEGGNFALASWDWWYYAEKLRKEKYNLDESELKPYFSLDNVREGAFNVAHKLWGISFEELKDVSVYNPEVKAFKVSDVDNSLLGILYVDYFPRSSKRAGAWMNNFVEEYTHNGEKRRPVIVNVGNFSKPLGDTPSLLNIDEVRTLFHEFGHALHGLLTQCNYPSVSGTSVTRDFVELPSQIMEHWAIHPEVLKMYAHHYKTGEVIPDSLIEKMQNASKFNTGFETTELVAAALLDLDYHMLTEFNGFDVNNFEEQIAQKIGLPKEIVYRYRGSYFSHIFSGGYATGYYGYLWAEVLDADAFDLFVKNGIFDASTAQSYRRNILEKGGSEDPMTLYVRFRGAEPNPEALMHNRGLAE